MRLPHLAAIEPRSNVACGDEAHSMCLAGDGGGDLLSGMTSGSDSKEQIVLSRNAFPSVVPLEWAYMRRRTHIGFQSVRNAPSAARGRDRPVVPKGSAP